MTNEQRMEERVEDWHASFSNLLFTQSVVGFLKDRMLEVGGKEGDLVWKVHVIYSVWISASLSSFNYQICTSSCFMKKKNEKHFTKCGISGITKSHEESKSEMTQTSAAEHFLIPTSAPYFSSLKRGKTCFLLLRWFIPHLSYSSRAPPFREASPTQIESGSPSASWLFYSVPKIRQVPLCAHLS